MPDKPELTWEPSALNDLTRLREFRAPHRPKAAANAARCIIQAANQLLGYPHFGYPMESLPEFNELIIPFGRNRYILRYRIDGQKVVILRVWLHAKIR